MQYNIEPIAVLSSEANGLIIEQVTVNIDAQTASVHCYITKDGTPIITQAVIISAEEYAEWGTDDDYIAQIVSKRLGITLMGK